MRLLLTNIFCIIAINLLGQIDLGIGLVSISFNDKTILHFYKSQLDSVPSKTLEFFDDKSINSWNIRYLEKQKEWLKPEVLWLDYSSFVFRCKTQTNDYFEVIVNNENGESYWLKKSELTKFSSWEKYLKEMFGIARLSNYSQKIRKLPNDSAEEIKFTGQDCFQVMSMKGDWIEIYTADYCDESYTSDNTKIKSGWIKWREGNKMLIEYYITS